MDKLINCKDEELITISLGSKEEIDRKS